MAYRRRTRCPPAPLPVQLQIRTEPECRTRNLLARVHVLQQKELTAWLDDTPQLREAAHSVG